MLLRRILERPHRPAVLNEALSSPHGRRQFRRALLHSAEDEVDGVDTVTSHGPLAVPLLTVAGIGPMILLEIPIDFVEVSTRTQLQVCDLR